MGTLPSFRSHTSTLLAFLLLCLWLDSLAVPARAFPCEMLLTPAVAEPGSTVRVCLRVTHDLPLTGLQASIYLDERLSIDLAKAHVENPEECDLDLYSEQGVNCVTIGVVDFSPEACVLPPSEERLMVVLPVTVSEEARPGDTLCLRLEDGCGIRNVENLVALRDPDGALQECRPGAEGLREGCITIVEHQEPPSDLSCEPSENEETGETSVRLSWISNGQYLAIEVYRDDELLATIDDGTSEYVDEAVPYGSHTYTLQAYSDCLGYPPLSADSCTANTFHRGDANNDGKLDLSDGVFVLNFLFLGDETPTCMEAANANDDPQVDITDGIYILNFLFLGGPAPLPPGPPSEACGTDVKEPDLGCEEYSNC